jgi:hypothetical protein
VGASEIHAPRPDERGSGLAGGLIGRRLGLLLEALMVRTELSLSRLNLGIELRHTLDLNPGQLRNTNRLVSCHSGIQKKRSTGREPS